MKELKKNLKDNSIDSKNNDEDDKSCVKIDT